MKERRWLLPFTHGVDSEALDLVCQMAQEANATVIAISLRIPEPGKGLQIEEIQEFKGFLECVHAQARMYQAIAERHEVWVATGDNLPSRIQTFVREYQCDSLVVIVKQGQGVLLQTDLVATLIVNSPAPLVLLRLPGRPQNDAWILRRYLAFLRKLCMRIYFFAPILKIEEGEKREELGACPPQGRRSKRAGS